MTLVHELAAHVEYVPIDARLSNLLAELARLQAEPERQARLSEAAPTAEKTS